jgi:hypothetical protein
MSFHDTAMGKKFYESDVPRIVIALESIAKSLHHNKKTAFMEMN